LSLVEYIRIYSDAKGESHMQKLQIELVSKRFAPPAPPLDVSSFEPASRCGFLLLPSGWYGDLHRTPERQWLFCMAGEMEFETSDGDVHRIVPGGAVLLDDMTGKGHRSRIISDTDVVLAAVQL
jgi:hypothetical protein